MNNDYKFRIFESVQPLSVQLPFSDKTEDISSWASSILPNGTIIAKNHIEPEKQQTQATYTIKPREAVSVNTPPINTSAFNIDDKNERVNYAFNYLMTKGKFSPIVSAAIAGNLYHESTGIDPTNDKGDNGSAFGIAQWRLDRQDNLRAFAKEQNKPVTDLTVQLDFLIKELNDYPIYGLRQLKSAKNLKDATQIFMNKFERPSSEYEHFGDRLKYATSIYSKYYGN